MSKSGQSKFELVGHVAEHMVVKAWEDSVGYMLKTIS